MGCAVDAQIRHGHTPRLKPVVEFLPGRETAASQGIAFDVFDPAFSLPLGLSPVGPAGPGDETIEASKVLKDRMPENFPFTASEYLSTGIIVETR